MKVFISWSGTISHRVAIVLRDWLPSVIQNIQPYVSSEDIDKGARWSTDIAGELHASTYGLICLTKDNIVAPWINFEAGALGKSIDKSRVSPFLFRLKRSEVEGPILQFQSTVFEQEDVFKLLKSINDACGPDGLEAARLQKSFGVWWPQLERQLSEIPAEVNPPEAEPAADLEPPVSDVSRVLEEILELTRNNHKILRSPESLLPVEYLQHVTRRAPRRDEFDFRVPEGQIHPGAIREMIEIYRDVLKLLGSAKGDLDRHPAFEEMLMLLRRMDDPLRYIAKELGLRLPREALGNKDEF
nr:TIR domain-containing protein [uncultured Rhodoferax sp.]